MSEQLAEANRHLAMSAEEAMRPVCFNTGCKGEEFIRLRDELERRERVAWESWGNQEDEHTPAIEAAHPVNSGDYETFSKALSMVGTRRGKYELVGLVNWLLARAESAEATLTRANAVLTEIAEQATEFEVARAAREALPPSQEPNQHV